MIWISLLFLAIAGFSFRHYHKTKKPEYLISAIVLIFTALLLPFVIMFYLMITTYKIK